MELQDLNPFVETAVKEVFEKMTFTDVEPLEPYWANSLVLEGDLAGAIDFSGDFSGRLVICCTRPFVVDVTANMLGVDGSEVAEAQVEDTVKELTNMTIGNILSTMDKEKVLAKLAIPTCYFNPKSDLKSDPGKPVLIFPFTYMSLSSENGETDRIFIELCL